MRESDLKWYQENRKTLAQKYDGQWLAVFNQTVIKSFPTELEAIEFAFGELANDEASVFQAVAKDPYVYIG